MDDRGLSRSQYQALVQSIKVLCPGCLDMNPSLLDWRAVSWMTLYPDLDHRKVVIGADSGCVSCTIIYAAFRSVGIDLRTSRNVQLLRLFQKDEEGSLLAMAIPDQGRNILVELYTV
jgi:hypothetical protein